MSRAEVKTTDIVEELRLLQSGAQWVCGDTARTLEQAADEIERLRAERDDAFRAGRAEGYAAGVQTWAVERVEAWRAGAEAMRKKVAKEGSRSGPSWLANFVLALPLPEAPE